jgi:hypothetical protein
MFGFRGNTLDKTLIRERLEQVLAQSGPDYSLSRRAAARKKSLFPSVNTAHETTGRSRGI